MRAARIQQTSAHRTASHGTTLEPPVLDGTGYRVRVQHGTRRKRLRADELEGAGRGAFREQALARAQQTG